MIESYNCIPKDNLYIAQDEILNLVNKYGCSKVQIGLINFADKSDEKFNFYDIGKVDLDILAIDKISLQVEVLDHDNPNHVLWFCSSNSKNFLESLLVFAEYTSLKIKNLSQKDGSLVLNQYVNKCIENAGGSVYTDFYKMIFGIYD